MHICYIICLLRLFYPYFTTTT